MFAMWDNLIGECLAQKVVNSNLIKSWKLLCTKYTQMINNSKNSYAMNSTYKVISKGLSHLYCHTLNQVRNTILILRFNIIKLMACVTFVDGWSPSHKTPLLFFYFYCDNYNSQLLIEVHTKNTKLLHNSL